ncbi:uncharacterized protein LOC143190435 [Rhynchophorus ferrugineus]|uniref:uncharacterized protein LOC143190435 n=1 Tax=Rhynchophorus ferrugineus TaxID=354439 RepID=UPI003FCE3D30
MNLMDQVELSHGSHAAIRTLCDQSHPRHEHTLLGLLPGLAVPDAVSSTSSFSSSVAATRHSMPTRALVKIFSSRSAYQLIAALVLLEIGCWWTAVIADCLYDNQKHPEGSEVPTGEPCLNCTCTRNVLLCYLRVCPQLPNPPPQGCILLHRYKTCCPELICSDFYDGGNSLEGRSETDTTLDLFPDEHLSHQNGCILEGSIYAPGSAMHTGSLCEYCYCLAGKQVCVKPKCLMNMDGCIPEFEETSCCPIRYNCTRPKDYIDITTTSTIKPDDDKGGCVVDNNYYNEGTKVIGVGHSICDNCYCMKGVLRCEPLSCAPPLLGCTPVIRPGECCAASYNCNGTIEIEAEPNYGPSPIISKEYSKFRKEVHTKAPPTIPQHKKGVVTVAPLYVLSDSWSNPTTKMISQRSSGTTRHFSGTFSSSSTPEPSNIRSSGTKILSEIKAKNSDDGNIPSPSLTVIENKDDALDYLDLNKFNILSIVDTLLDTTIYDKEQDKNHEHSNDTVTNSTITYHGIKEGEDSDLEDSTSDDSTVVSTSTEMVETTTNYIDDSATSILTNVNLMESTTTEEPTTFIDISTNAEVITLRSVVKSTDCINSIEHVLSPDTVVETTTLMTENPNSLNNLSDVHTEILIDNNITEKINHMENHMEFNEVSENPTAKTNNTETENLDYDYVEPTLPNVKIIPFVAADALDVKKESPEDRVPIFSNNKIETVTLGYNTNLFSPPTKTEGGFVPKEPPILQSFYTNIFPPVNTMAPKVNTNVNCISNNQEITHGTSMASNSPCMTCTCFYGNVVCQKPNCPPPRPGCKEAAKQGANLCCPNYVCDDHIIVDRYDIVPELVTVAEGIIPADPFKDVIKTEPAPDLQSLMGDMISLQKGTTTKLPVEKGFTTTPKVDIPSTTTDHQDFFELDKIWKLIFSDEDRPTTDEQTNFRKPPNTVNNNLNTNNSDNSLPSTTKTPNSGKTDNVSDKANKTNSHKFATSDDKIENNTIGVGLLKLAGCNIYGRMYRVGRIISELSGPCLECKCTEIGVQCRQLKC